MYRLSLATSAVSTVNLPKLFAATKLVTCTSYYCNNIVSECVSVSSTAVQHSSSLHQLLQVLSAHASSQDTSVINALMNKLIAFDVDDASSLAIAQAVASTKKETKLSSTHSDERVQSSPSLIVEVMKTHKQSLPIRAKCSRCLANMCLINKDMYQITSTACNDMNTNNTPNTTTTKMSNVLVEQLLDDGALELVLGTMQLFHSVKAQMLNSLQFNEDKNWNNHCTREESETEQEIMGAKHDVCKEEIDDSVDIWKQCSWVTLACCNLICLSEGGVKRGVQLNGIEVLTEFIFLLLSMIEEVQKNAISTKTYKEYCQNRTQHTMCLMLLNRSLDSCMASLTALLTSEVQLEDEHKVEKHHQEEKLSETVKYRKPSEIQEMPLSAVNNYNYQQVSYSTMECIVLLTIYASQCVSSKLSSNQQEIVHMNEMVEENNLSDYLELLHKSWMALQYIASYKPNVPLLYSVFYDLLELHEVHIDTTDFSKSTTSKTNNRDATINTSIDLHKTSEGKAVKSRTHGLWLFNALWQAAWHFVAESFQFKNKYLKVSAEEVEEKHNPSQRGQLTSALHYSVLRVLNALVAPREDVINTSTRNDNNNDISNKTVVTNVNRNSNTSTSSSESHSEHLISPSLSAQVVYRLITTNDVICHNFALSTIAQIHYIWRQHQQQQQQHQETESCRNCLRSNLYADVPSPFTLDQYKLLREALLLLHHLTLQVRLMNNVKDETGAKEHDNSNSIIKNSEDSVSNANCTEQKKSENEEINNSKEIKHITERDSIMNSKEYIDEEANDLISVNTLIILQHIMEGVKWTLTSVHKKYKGDSIKQLFSQLTESNAEADQLTTKTTAEVTTESCEDNKMESAHLKHNATEDGIENNDNMQINKNDRTVLLQQMAFAGYVYSIVWNCLAALSHHPFQGFPLTKNTVDSEKNNINIKDDSHFALHCALMNDELNLISVIEEVQHMLSTVFMQAREGARAEFAARHPVTNGDNNNKEESAMSSQNTPWTPNAFEETLSKLITLGEKLL